MNLNNLKIRTRLGLGFGAVLMLLVAIVGISYQQLRQSALTVDGMVEYQRRSEMADAWESKTQLNVSRAVSIAKTAGLTDVQSYLGPLMKQTTEEINALQKDLESSISSPEGKALFAEVGERRKVYIAAREKVMASLKQADQPAVDATLNNEMLPAATAYLNSMGKFQKYQADKASANVEVVRSALVRAEVVLVVLMAVSLAIGGALALAITRSITGPLIDAVKVAEHISNSDLSRDIRTDRKDEMGDLMRALAHMQQSLRTLVGQVRSATGNISTASAEIATGNQDLSSRTEQTASNLQQTASSMEQLTGTVKQSADSARQANQLASSAAEVAARGGTVVSQVVSTMDEINTSSKKIADIISVIDGIAFQTNILALNAAVEAARAGEQGRGFAVVAGEVRSLAGRSAEAAKEIKSLIGASVERVDAGSRLVADAGQTMQEIVGSVQRVSDIIGEITAAAAEQSDGIGQVNGAVLQLDQMTQQNAALVEESAAAAESLSDQAKRLAAVVGTFRLETDAGMPTVSSGLSPHGNAASPARSLASKPSMPPPAPARKALNATPSAARPSLNKPTPATPTTPAARLAPPRDAAPANPPAARPASVPTAAAQDAGGDWETF